MVFKEGDLHESFRVSDSPQLLEGRRQLPSPRRTTRSAHQRVGVQHPHRVAHQPDQPHLEHILDWLEMQSHIFYHYVFLY
jgi:hypothetical protein